MTAKLGDGATGDTVFSEKFDGTLEDMFAIQDRLAARASEALQTGAEPRASRPAPRIDAYERHARGRRFFHRLEKGTMDQARILFEEAAGADADYAPALAGLAAVHAMRFPFQTDRRELELSESYARRAIAADPELAEPRLWLGYASASRAARRGHRTGAPRDGARPDDSVRSLFRRVLRREHGTARRRPAPLSAHGRGRSAARLRLARARMDAPRARPAAEARWCLERAVAIEGESRSARPPESPAISASVCAAPETSRTRGAPASAVSRRSRDPTTCTATRFEASACARSAGPRSSKGTRDAAHAAFTQAVPHLRGRPRALGGGHLLVQAIAGLSRAGDGTGALDEAARALREAARDTAST